MKVTLVMSLMEGLPNEDVKPVVYEGILTDKHVDKIARDFGAGYLKSGGGYKVTKNTGGWYVQYCLHDPDDAVPKGLGIDKNNDQYWNGLMSLEIWILDTTSHPSWGDEMCAMRVAGNKYTLFPPKELFKGE